MESDSKRLDSLRMTTHESPEQADWRVLCSLLKSEDTEIKTEAEDLRSTLIETHPNPEEAAEQLIGLLTEEASLRRTAVDTLSRLVRSDHSQLVQRIGTLLTSDGIRESGCACYVLAGATNQHTAVVKPYIPNLIGLLDHDDLRIRSLALYALNGAASSYPALTVDAVPAAAALLEYQGIAGGEPDKPGVAPVPNRDVPDRLTPRLVRPRDQAAEFLATIATTHPEEVIPAIDALVELIDRLNGHDMGFPPAIGALFPIARHSPSVVTEAEAIPALESCLDTDVIAVKTAALNVLNELGEDVSTTERIPSVTPADRDEPVQDGDLERAREMKMEIHAVEGVDLDEILRLLRSTDSEVRDAMAFSAQFLTDVRNDEIHARGAEFLVLVGEPHDCTRGHLVDGTPGLLSRVASTYPREWKPALEELLASDSPRVRADALSIMGSAAGSYPSGYRTELDTCIRYLDDEQPLLRDAALGVINALATAYPEDIVEHLPRIVAALNDETTRSMALAVLQTIAKRDAAGLAPVVDDVRGVFRTLATVDIDAGESVTDPAGRRVQLTEGDPSRRLVLSVLFELAKHDPTWILAVQPHLTELVEANVDGWQTALDILQELK